MIKLCIVDVIGVSVVFFSVDFGIIFYMINIVVIIIEMIKMGVSFFID